MSWSNESLQGYELECKAKMDMFLNRLARPGTEDEWMEIIRVKVPGYLHAKALEYVMEEQNKKSFDRNVAASVTSTRTHK